MSLERIRKLFGLARDSPRQKRYVELAKRVSTRTRTKIPKELKRQVCKGCGALLVPGKNATVRTEKGKISVKCKECGKLHRIPFKPSK
jgi:ribonuclease P protein subunit RPR2